MLATFGAMIASIFGGLALLHVYWALGGVRGFIAALPTKGDTPLFMPTPTITILVAITLFVGCALVLANTGYLGDGIPIWLLRVGIWAMAAVLLLRALGDFRYVGVFKRVRDTAFARRDTRYFSPLCFFLAISCAAIGFLIL